MKKRIQIKLDKIQKKLDSDFMYMALASLEKKENQNFPQQRYEESLKNYFLLKNQYDDMRLGDIVFWVDEEIFQERQMYLMIYEVPNPNQWVCIGDVGPYPLIINKKNGNVNCVISEPGLECQIKEYGEFEKFMDEFVLGEKYFELGTDEEWYEFMEKNEIM